MTDGSCLVQKLSHYSTLSQRSMDNVARLEREEQDFAKGMEIHQGGEENTNLYVVKSGWLYSYTDMKDGRRQIVEIHHPGDIIGFPDIAFDKCTSVLRTAEDVRLCPFPKKDLDQVFTDAPQLAALLFSLAVRNQVVMTDFLRAVGRMSARERIAYFLLDLKARLRTANKKMTTIFRLPLNQTEISDVLGLTNVYVSRSFTALQKDGLIRRDNGTVEVLEEEKLIRLCDFVDHHSRIDTSWFPEQ